MVGWWILLVVEVFGDLSIQIHLLPRIVRVSTRFFYYQWILNQSFACGNPTDSSIINIDYTDQGLNCGGLSYQVSQGIWDSNFAPPGGALGLVENPCPRWKVWCLWWCIRRCWTKTARRWWKIWQRNHYCTISARVRTFLLTHLFCRHFSVYSRFEP